MPESAPQPGLLFVPDISGFSDFVNATAVTHSRHIIEELLETLIDANELDLEVSEVEGDAILFYRFGPAPSAGALFAQVKRMFIAFHAYLRRYDTQRICRCGACAGAGGLGLKIIAHQATISQARVREHVKLFGQDVIAVHRLLKNNVPQREYVLLTRALADAWPPGAAPEWAGRESGSCEYDIGTLAYDYVPLEPLRSQVPAPKVEDFGVPGARIHAFSCEVTVKAPMEFVFEVATDLPARLEWMDGVKRVELPDPGVNRIGTRHRCLIDMTSPMVVTSAIAHAEDSITFTETDEKRMGCAVFAFRRRKLAATFRKSLEKLSRYCEKRYESSQA
ncbi:MAG: DUF2652 domain-containing protein [Betaproteobacteria bacterium]